MFVIALKEVCMSIHEFSKQVTKLEALKKQVSIGQIKEVLKHINNLTHGALYGIIKLL